MKPKCLDLFCKAGGASMGYHWAGFDVTGVDIQPQKHYPFKFIQADAFEYLESHWQEYDFIAASPPCQKWCNHNKNNGHKNYPDLITPLREILLNLGKPYVIENVPRAPLFNPVMLCGSMFPELRVYRHRIFESNISIDTLVHYPHDDNTPQAGHGGISAKGFISVSGHFSNVAYAQEAMGIDWMGQEGLREAIPPAYTEFIGRQIIKALE